MNRTEAVWHRSLRGPIFSTRLHVLALTFILIVPVLAAAGLLAYRFAASQSTMYEQMAQTAAQGASASVEREIYGMTTALQVLATSPDLAANNLSQFHRNAVEVGTLQNAVIGLRSARHEQLLYSLVPFGQPLPTPSNLIETDGRARAAGAPVVSDFYFGRIGGRPSIAVVVPIMNNGELRYFLSASFDVERIRNALLLQRVPDGWRASVRDSKGIVIARSDARGNDVHVASALMLSGDAGVDFQRNIASGQGPIFLSQQRTTDGWIVAINGPESLITNSVTRAIASTLAGTLLLVALALGSAFVIARRISSPMKALAGMGVSIARGDETPVQVFGNVEANDVARSLAGASVILRERESDLKIAEERYRRLFNSIDEAFCVIEVLFDEAGKPIDYLFVEANPILESQTGLRDVVGKRMRDIVPDIEQHWIDIYGRVVLTGETERFEHESGVMGRWFSVYASRVEGVSRNLVAIVFSDITARRQAELALTASEKRYRSALRVGRIGAWETNYGTGVRHWSEEGMALFGLKLPGGKGIAGGDDDEWKNALHPYDHDKYEHIRAEIREKDQFQVEYRINGPGGRMIWLMGHGEVSERGPGGEPLRLVNVVADITDRKLSEEALRDSEARLAAALKAGQLGVYEWNLTTNAMQWDETILEMWGVSQNEPHDFETFESRLHADDKPAVQIALKEALDPSGDGHFHSEYRILPRNQPMRWIVADGNVTFATQEPVRLTGTVRDVTSRKKAEEQRMLLIHELNHRVKNTLATVQSIAGQTLRRYKVDPAIRTTFEQRLFALGRAHDVLTQESWQGADLGVIVENAVHPLMSEQSRYRIKGPHVRMTPHEAVTVAMAIHELGTNALKYGAWSNLSGMVLLEWEMISEGGEPLLQLVWDEKGGPPVTPPKNKGFGSRLLDQGLALEFGQGAQLIYHADGLKCIILARLGLVEDRNSNLSLLVQ